MKKTLALILAIVMCFSLFAIGASAANEEFTDKAEIDHTKAVNLLVGLGVINGMGDGTFAPNGTVTRAQMCQIVAKICNGGVLPNVNTTEQHFTDVPTNHWAFKAVEYCVGKGIVAGFGDGTFQPEQALTASQCAKMLLVAMGYNETAHKLTGASWEIYTAIYANANDFYKELSDVAVDQPITREHVAQMARNMLDARVVKAAQEIDSNGVITTKYSQTNAAGTADNPDVIEEYFGVAIEYGYLTGSTYNKTKKQWTYTIDSTDDAAEKFNGSKIDKDPFGTYVDRQGNTVRSSGTVKSKTDFNNLTGRQVCVVYDADDHEVVYDIYATEDSTVIATGLVSDIDDNILDNDGKVIGKKDTIKFADVEYDLTDTVAETPVYRTNGKNLDGSTTGTTDNIGTLCQQTDSDYGWWAVSLVDNDGDGKVDLAIVKAVTIAKVTALTKTTISMQAKQNGQMIDKLTGIDLDDEDWAFDSKIEKKDFVVISVGTDRVNNVTPLEKVTGKATAIKSDGDKAKIEGVFYNFTPSGKTADINSTYDIQVFNGFAFDVSKTGAGSTDLVLVKKYETEGNFGDVLAKVMFPDGTTKTVTIAKIIYVDYVDNDYVEVELKREGNNIQAFDEKLTNDTLYTYEVNKDGEYELTVLVDDEDPLDNDDANHAGFDGLRKQDTFQKADSNNAAKLAGMIIDDTAVVMVKYDNGDKYAVIKGSDLKKYNLKTADVSKVQALYDEDGGINKVQFAFVDCGSKSSFGADDVYGYVTKVVETTKVDGTTYTVCKVWTADGEIEASIEKGANLDKGDCIILEKNSDGTYTLSDKEFFAGKVAITGYSETDKYVEILLNNNSDAGLRIVLPDDVTIINVNTEDIKGVGAGEIETADKDETGDYIYNARYYTDGTGYTDTDIDTLVLVIDVNDNVWHDAD